VSDAAAGRPARFCCLARFNRRVVFAGLASLTCVTAIGCAPPLKPDPHYVLGTPYQAGSVWFYPRESYDLDETGLAGIVKNNTGRLTSDGEVFDQTVLAAAHPTSQLPAIARLTNLENGHEITLRLNDRGSGDPHRLVEVTRRAAELLDMPPNGATRVRLRILPNESHAATDAVPGAPALAMTAAPRGTVEVAELPPPAGVRQSGGDRVSHAVSLAPPAEATPPAPPMRLPETVVQTSPRPGLLIVRLDIFDDYRYAAAQRARMAAAGARIVPVVQGRGHRFEVEIGPLPDVARADSVLEEALAAGIPDARIVVE
jgi:rare lipoprotein A